MGACLVTRLRTLPAEGQLDLPTAFRILGTAPSFRELRLVVRLLRESGVQEVAYDEDLVELAAANGSSAFDALDLAVAVNHGVECLYAGPPKPLAPRT